MLCSTANPLLSHTLSAIQFWCPIASDYPKKKKRRGGQGGCPKYRFFICFWWFVWFRNLQLRWHGGICKEAGQECKEEEGAFHQEIFQTKKQLATEAPTDFCASSFVLVHVCMLILKNWARCAFPASYMMTFLCTEYVHIYQGAALVPHASNVTTITSRAWWWCFTPYPVCCVYFQILKNSLSVHSSSRNTRTHAHIGMDWNHF